MWSGAGRGGGLMNYVLSIEYSFELRELFTGCRCRYWRAKTGTRSCTTALTRTAGSGRSEQLSVSTSSCCSSVETVSVTCWLLSYKDVNEAREKWGRGRGRGRSHRWVIKTPYRPIWTLALQHKIYQYQEITLSMAVTTVSMHYTEKLTSIEYYETSNNFLVFVVMSAIFTPAMFTFGTDFNGLI